MNSPFEAPQSQTSKKLLIVAGILLLAGLVIFLLFSNKPEAKKRPSREKAVSVKVTKAEAQNYPVLVSASGSVSAITRSQLTAQVRGEITYVSEKFNNGGQFKKGETLLRIDNREYIASSSNAQASFLQAQSQFSLEEMNAKQAVKDWERLGFEGEPNALVLREPQLLAAEASLTSAKAAYDSAKTDLARTRISAPYNGFTIKRDVSLGQYVSIGTRLGEVYSTKGIEVSLPLTQNSFAQLDFKQSIAVKLNATFAGIKHTWPAVITRADSLFDPTTRQINVVATVSNTISDQGLELKVGQFVNATIEGREAKNVFVIPNSSIREGRYVFLFSDDKLLRRDITIVWQDANNSIVENIEIGDQVITTSLGGAVSGTKAKLIGAKPKQQKGHTEKGQRP